MANPRRQTYTPDPEEEYVVKTNAGQFVICNFDRIISTVAANDYMNVGDKFLKVLTRDDWKQRWPNFPPEELQCRGTGDLRIEVKALDRLQRLRNEIGHPLNINSAYRSVKHNSTIKDAAKNSMHTWGMAFDIDCRNCDRHDLYRLADRGGSFTGFGFYDKSDFLHIDTGPADEWGDRRKFFAASSGTRFSKEQPVKPDSFKQDRKAQLSLAGAATAAPGVISSIGGLGLPQWLVAGGFIIALGIGAFLAWNYYKENSK